MSLPISARLTFIGLWSYVDDNGVGDARVSSIVGDLYADDMARDPQETLKRVSGDLQTLENVGLIVSYSDKNHPNRSLIFIRNWTRHQVVNRPSKGNGYPLPSDDELSLPAETSELDKHSGDTQETLMRIPETLSAGAGEQGSRGAGEQGSSKERPTRESDKRSEYTDEFNEFWSNYPRRDQKRPAFMAWQKAIKHTNPETIIEGAARLSSDPNLPEKTYIRLPSTWLNGDGWEDGPLPERAGNKSQPKLSVREQRHIQAELLKDNPDPRVIEMARKNGYGPGPDHGAFADRSGVRQSQYRPHDDRGVVGGGASRQLEA